MIAISLSKYLSPTMANLIEQLIHQTGCTIPEITDENGLLHWLLQHTQSHWLRKGGTERWEIEDTIAADPGVLSILEGSELVVELPPAVEKFDHVLLMSALEPAFLTRLKYFSHLVSQGLQVEHVYLLGGQRKLHPQYEAEAIRVLPPNSREIDMLEHHAARIRRRDAHLVGMEFIACSTDYQVDSTGAVRRPNTRDTVITWKNQHDDGGSVLCLTNQPFVHYQTETVRLVLGESSEVHGAGSAIELNPLNAPLALDTIARLLYTKLPTKLRNIL